MTQITGETERKPSQEANHGAENPKVSAETPTALKSITRKTTVKWPPISKNKEMGMFEEDIHKILDTALIGNWCKGFCCEIYGKVDERIGAGRERKTNTY